LCPSSVCVVATFPGTVSFPLLYSLLLFFSPNTNKLQQTGEGAGESQAP